MLSVNVNVKQTYSFFSSINSDFSCHVIAFLTFFLNCSKLPWHMCYECFMQSNIIAYENNRESSECPFHQKYQNLLNNSFYHFMASLHNEVELKGGGGGRIAEEEGTFRPIYTLDGEVLSSSASFFPPSLVPLSLHERQTLSSSAVPPSLRSWRSWKESPALPHLISSLNHTCH